MTRLQLTVASLAFVCFASFAAGAFTVFDRVGGPGPGLLAITIGAAIGAVMEMIELLASVAHPQRRTHRTLLKRARPTAFLGRVGEPRASSSKAQACDRSKTGTDQE